MVDVVVAEMVAVMVGDCVAVCDADEPRDRDAVTVCEVVGVTVDEGDGTKHEVRMREPAAPAPPVGAPPTYVTELVSDVTFALM